MASSSCGILLLNLDAAPGVRGVQRERLLKLRRPVWVGLAGPESAAPGEGVAAVRAAESVEPVGADIGSASLPVEGEIKDYVDARAILRYGSTPD